MSIKISIIIPVYNVEGYLSECLESIILQKYDNKEIILVDDGSTDNSPQICDEYANKYDYIKVIHKSNGGPSDARNIGIEEAIGDYILFVDSDDFINVNSLEKIAESAGNNADVVFLCGVKYMHNGELIVPPERIIKSDLEGKSIEEVYKLLSELPKFPASACTKLVKRQLFDTWDILKFEKGILCEDIDWTLNLLSISQKFAVCDYRYYFYRQSREGSRTNNISRQHISDLIYIINKWIGKAKSEQGYKRKFIINTLAYEYLLLITFYGGLQGDEKKALKKEIVHLKWLLNERKEKRYIAIKWITKLLGLNCSAFLLNFYLRHR